MENIEIVDSEKPGHHTLVALVKGTENPEVLTVNLSAQIARGIRDAALAIEHDGKAGTLRIVPAPGPGGIKHFALVGIGDELTEGAVREAFGMALLNPQVGTDVAIVVPGDEKILQAALEGALLGSYRFDHYLSQKVSFNPIGVVTQIPAESLEQPLHRAQVLAQAAFRIRDLGNLAPNDLYPQAYVEKIQSWAKDLPVTVEVWDERRLAKENCGGIVGVGQGSKCPPRLVKVTYAPKDAVSKVALVGKGITFDTGGISLKPAKGMDAMKSDMLGSATMLNAVLAAARLELKVGVVAFLALAENMPGGHAMRPGDIITMSDGTTVEVTNTDAEGRLVMADALVQATKEDPQVILDMATLTGAQIVALGTRTAGVMGDEDVRTALVEAAQEAGELMWPMPLPDHLKEGLKSHFADMVNANVTSREGGMLSAGWFLRHFAKDFPWAHIDIAGPSYNEGSPWGYTPRGATGMGLRTLVTYLEHFE